MSGPNILSTALKATESHPKATHKPPTSALLALYYGILKLRYRCDALAPGLHHAWKALGGGLELAGGLPESVRTGLDWRIGRR